MNNLDRYIQTIYLAASSVREEMLESLVENALYNFDEPLSFDDIKFIIKETFSLELIQSELKSSLDRLVSKEVADVLNGKWKLKDQAKKNILSRQLEHDKLKDERYKNFAKVLSIISDTDLDNDLKNKLWSEYNNYIIECFRIHAKDAINLFLPFESNEKIEGSSSKSYQTYCRKFNIDRERIIFEKLVSSYPKYLSESDLNYLNNLQERTESFSSLGFPKDEYEKVAQEKFLNWIIIADTNFLLSVLGIRPHPENDACQELAKISKEKKVKIRFVYFPETLRELRNPGRTQIFDNIPKSKLTVNQMRALVESNQIDSTAAHYFRRKLDDSATPHPTEILFNAKLKLKSKGIELYNSPVISRLQDAENGKYLADRYLEYEDFETKILKQNGIVFE